MMDKICLLIILAGVPLLLSTTIIAQKCPPPGEGLGTCIEACSNDGNCSNGQLCCSNGCGHECMSPADPCPTCATPDCHELSPGTITPEGECCPVCACAASDGRMVPAGTGFMNDCNKCLCGSTGVALCTLIFCPPITSPTTTPTTPSTDPITLPTSPPSAMCPNATGLIGTCVERCSGDDKCKDGQLCCSNGCGRECMDPVLDCSAILCFQPNCTSPSVPATPKGSCCPVCGCQTSDGAIAAGETYQPDSCNTCTCLENGLVICTLAFCPLPTNGTPTTQETTSTPTISPTMPECSVSKVMGRARHNRRRVRTTLRFSSDGDPLVSYKCKLDNEDFKNCTSPVVWRNLTRGRHTVIVKGICSDDEGKESASASRRIRFRVR